MTERDWELQAACRAAEDPDLWFRKKDRVKARTICRQECPVREECLAAVLAREEGLGAGYRAGIFAGLNGAQRAVLARNQEAKVRKETATKPAAPVKRRGPGRKPAPCGTRAAYQRHRAKKEPVDDACRAANNLAKREYQRTGSSVLRTAV
ncbi:WhiB family transcriptional regulator [Streptomyces spiralis]